MKKIKAIHITFCGENGFRSHTAEISISGTGLSVLNKETKLFESIDKYLDNTFDFNHGAKGNLILTPGSNQSEWLANGIWGSYIEGSEDELSEDEPDDNRFKWRKIINKPATLDSIEF